MATGSAPTAVRPAGFDKLVTLINQNSSAPLIAGQLNVGIPAAQSGDGTGLATGITVSATDDSPYIGSVMFNYNRLDMNVILQRPAGVDPIITYRQMSAASFIDGLNSIHASSVDPTDLATPFNLTQAAMDTESLAVTAHPNSLTIASTTTIPMLFVPIEELESGAATFSSFVNSFASLFKGK